MRYLPLLVLFFLLACHNQETTPKKDDKSGDWILGPFNKADAANPIMVPDSASSFNCPVRNALIKWENKNVFNPAATVRHDTLILLYRAQDNIGGDITTSRIGLAWSTDGLHFKKYPTPVLYPDKDSSKKYEWPGGCEDPRLIEDDSGQYFLTYTAFDGSKARLMVASSMDLYHWTKHGPAFAAANGGKYLDLWSKSGSIVSTYDKGRIIATRIKGKYWMYWGDTEIFLASSTDLIHWTPVEDSAGKLLVVFGPRKGKFDSDLVEPGPPAMVTSRGILLIYNCRNVPDKGDSSLALGTYAPSQILLDGSDPGTVVKRMETYFMKPEKDYEIKGQVGHVCFAEGLVNYLNKWFLYYGTADSKIAVAVSDQSY